MNDMSRIWRIPTPPPDRSLREAMTRGFLGRCPSCGRGRLFRSYLKVVNACEVCGEDFSGHRADDAPAYITLLIVAHVVGAGILMSDEIWPHSSMLWVALFWLAVTLVASLLILPRAKGAIVGQQWALGMHGFGSHLSNKIVTEPAPRDRVLSVPATPPRSFSSIISRARRGAGADGQAACGPSVHAGQVRLSRRPGRARGSAHGRGRGARRACRGEAQRARASALARASRGLSRLPQFAKLSRKRVSPSASSARARQKIRRLAPGPASRRRASILRSTPLTSSPARSPRRDARGGSTPAFSLSTPASSPCASTAPFMLRLNWSSSSGRRSTRRETSTCPRSPTWRSTTSPKRSKAAWTNADRGPSIASSEESGCGSSFREGPWRLRGQPHRRQSSGQLHQREMIGPARFGASDCNAPSPHRAVRS